jgi:hypothetical protein
MHAAACRNSQNEGLHEMPVTRLQEQCMQCSQDIVSQLLAGTSNSATCITSTCDRRGATLQEPTSLLAGTTQRDQLLTTPHQHAML